MVKTSFCLIVSIIIISSCQKRTETDSNIDLIEQQSGITIALAENEEKLQYGGIVYNTIVNDDNVNIRSYPSLQSDVLFQVSKDTRIRIIGVSKEKNTIDNYNGHWLLVTIRENQPNGWETGWIFSKYVNGGDIEPSEINVADLTPEEPIQTRKLDLTYKKLPNQSFWTFVWDEYIVNYRYNNIPGSYAWYPETNELRHITYIGTSEESAWVIFTDDFKYALQDSGTSPGIRGLSVWRVNDGRKIFSGTYLRDIKLNGYTIEIVYEYSRLFMDRLDNEIITFAENFEQNNPEPENMVQYARETGLVILLVITCELNLDTGARKIINGEYIYSQ